MIFLMCYLSDLNTRPTEAPIPYFDHEDFSIYLKVHWLVQSCLVAEIPMNIGEMTTLLRHVLLNVSLYTIPYLSGFFITVYGGFPRKIVATGVLDALRNRRERGPLMEGSNSTVALTAATS